MDFLDPLSEPEYFLMFFKQHAKQDDFKWQRVGCVCHRGEMLAGGGEEVVQHELVASSQGAAELGERFLFL